MKQKPIEITIKNSSKRDLNKDLVEIGNKVFEAAQLAEKHCFFETAKHLYEEAQCLSRVYLQSEIFAFRKLVGVLEEKEKRTKKASPKSRGQRK